MKKLLLIIMTLILCVFMIVPCLADESTSDVSIISPGLAVISSKYSMAKSSLSGGDIEICQDDFQRSLNLSKISGITVSAVPDSVDGTLMLGSICVINGQHISGANLDLLKFVPATTDVKVSKFTFVTDYGCPVDFNLYFLTKVNYCPTTENAIFTSLDVETYKNTEYFGKLYANDTENDNLRFEIIEYPNHGTLEITNMQNGSYVYTPLEDDIGIENFTYVVCDTYGNYSASCEVSITVKKARTSIIYADLDYNPAENCATELTERNIMSGTQVGNIYYFYPQHSISRAEFLTMAMNCANIETTQNDTTCIFTDIDSVSDNMKNYIKTAYEVGVLDGLYIKGEECAFEPDGNISRAEAAVIVNNILILKDKTANQISINTSDVQNKTVPVWAEDAMYTLASLDILQISGNEIPTGSSNLTRAECAQMLMQLIRIIDNE